MRKADLVVSTILALIGLLVVGDALRLGHGWGANGPESGYVPFWLGAILIACSVFTFVKALRALRKEGEKKRLMPKGALKPVLWVMVPAMGMIFLTELVGLHVAAALYLAFYMRAVGKIGWVTVVSIAVLIPLSLYIAFDKLFLVPLPQGLWGSYILRF